MKSVLLTCDREGGFVRAAVWREGELIDLYVDREDKPDLTGALARGKVVRVTAAGKAAFFDVGLSEKIYVESKDVLCVGEIRNLRIRTTRGQNKASTGIVVGKDEEKGVLGLISPPPAPWEKALKDRGTTKTQCRFSTLKDWQECQAYALSHKLIEVEPLFSKSPHPHLSDKIEELLAPRILLRGGAEIVIEQTESLTAVDVNLGGAKNAVSVNIEAMREIARQIRLRNIGGIIVIDALKMKARADKNNVLVALSRACEGDPAGVDVFGITKLGLVEMTRTRKGPSLEELF